MTLSVIKRFHGVFADRSVLRTILHDIRSTCALFDDVIFCHVRRSMNKVAHALARWGWESSAPCVWVEEAHFDVERVTREDWLA